MAAYADAMTSADSSSTSPSTGGGTLTAFKVLAVLVGLAALVQAGLGFAVMGGSGVRGTHQAIGMGTIVLALVAAIVAGLWARGDWSSRKGIAFHAIAVVVLALIQVALGEAGVTTIHMTIGIVYLVAAVALATLALRKA